MDQEKPSSSSTKETSDKNLRELSSPSGRKRPSTKEKRSKKIKHTPTTPLLSKIIPIRLKRIGDSKNYAIQTPVYKIYTCTCGKIIFTMINISGTPISDCACAKRILPPEDEKRVSTLYKVVPFDPRKPNCFMPRVFFEYCALPFVGPTPLICASPCVDENCPDKTLHLAHTHDP